MEQYGSITEIIVAVAAWVTILGAIIGSYYKTKEGQAVLAKDVENLRNKIDEHSSKLEKGDHRMKDIEKKQGELEKAAVILRSTTDNLNSFVDYMREIKPMSENLASINSSLGDVAEKFHDIDIRVTKLEK